MMYNFPFYPQFPPRAYNSYPQNIHNSFRDKNKKRNDNPKPTGNSTSKDNDDDNILEIFGIKLHSDDILLICLLFFLYKEGANDEYLFISLILLLLS